MLNVPIRIYEVDTLGSCEVETDTAGLQTDDEHFRVAGRCLEA